jgi:cyclomaltodextrinase
VKELAMAHDTPQWLKSAALYQVYIRNFTAEGTLHAAAKRLSEVRDLGFDIICLTPIHPIGAMGRKGRLGSPYAVRDYRAVDPALGTMDDLREFLAAAHGLGLKVLMDVVFNHTSRDSVLLQQHPQWFLKDTNGNPMCKIADWSDVYDLDHSHAALRDYLIETLAGWVNEGFDGFRCDVATFVPLEFWRAARARLSSVKPLVWLAESVESGYVKYMRDCGWYAASDPELHEAFDVSYEYDGFEYLKAYLRGEQGLESYIRHVSIQETLFPANSLKARFLENHDQPRAAAVFGPLDRLLNWTAFSQLLPGLIFVYMGQERAIDKRPDLFDSDPVAWDQGSDRFLSLFGSVLAAGKKIKSRTRVFTLRQLALGVLALRWQEQARGSAYTTLVNLEQRFGEVRLPFPLRGKDMLTGAAVDLAGGPAAQSIPIPRTPLIVEEA